MFVGFSSITIFHHFSMLFFLWFAYGFPGVHVLTLANEDNRDPASHLFCKGAQPHVAARCVVKAQRTASVMVVPVQTTGAGASGFGKVWTILTMVSGVYIYNIILLYTKWCVLIIYYIYIYCIHDIYIYICIRCINIQSLYI